MAMTPSNDPAVPASFGAILREQLAAAEKRCRLEWLGRSLGWLGIGLAAAFTGWALLALARPAAAREWPAGLMLALLATLGVVGESFRRAPDWPRIRRRVDQQLGLPDTVLTAAEFQEAPAASPAWVERQLEQTAERLRGVRWQSVWPVRLPWRARAAFVVALAAMGGVGWQFAALRASERPPAATPRERDAAQALRDVLNDWDKSEQEQPDPELKKLLADLQPLREKLARKDAALDEREAFTALSRVEEKLAAMQAKLAAQSLQPMAAEMAAAMDKVDGLSTLAAALRRNDFEKAEAHADQAAQQMAKPGAKPPGGEAAADAAGRFGKLAQQFGEKGNGGAQQSMSQMQSGLQQNQGQPMSEGLKGLKASLAGQNLRESQKRNLNLQLKQMSVCKGCLGDKESMCRGMSLIPKLSMFRSQKAGHGAGSEVDPNRAGAPTELASDRNREHLAGTANEQGESETTSLSTLDPTAERAGARGAANFQAYEKLSQQAVADENLPLAHRETIKRYFESIRPAAQDKP